MRMEKDMELMKDTEFQKYLEDNGWVIECESPLEVRHSEGSFATLYAAKVLLGELHEQYKEEKEVSAASEEYSHQNNYTELKKLFSSMESYVNAAWAQEAKDANIGINLGEDGLSSESYALWETAYSLIFNKNLSHKIRDIFNELNINFEYYDPDTSYKEDVLAYYNAVKHEVETLTKLIEPEALSRKMKM